MRKYLFALIIPVFLSVTSISCTSNNNSGVAGSGDSKDNASGLTSDKSSLPEITFAEDTHDFGKLTAGEKVTFAFKFKNTGKSPLVISNVSTSCGCTVSDYPKKPVKPGEGASIDVSFDSEGKHGFQSKTITVNTNAQPPVNTLRIQSQVIEAPDK